MKSADQILFLLKTHGPQSAQQLAERLGITSMGARRQLEAAQEKGLVETEDVASKIGRPTRQWRLSHTGHARFPDRHADLTVQLIGQARAVFGESGLERLIDARDKAIEANYMLALADQPGIAARARALAHVRDHEGYMAEAQVQQDGSVLLIENHCPVCAAASACQNFCRSELEIFQRVMGADCTVERTEHLLSGARRCVYLIKLT
ncbi:MAG: metalloregulator ArsR/SmtB family transcription factor [Pseudomonadota bacterium]